VSWADISAVLLKSESSFDKLNLSFPDNEEILPFPKIIKLTLKLIEESISKNQNKIIVVYPERIYLPSMTVIFQAISDIVSGKLRTDYDIYSFQKSQRLKIDNLICKFVEIKTDKDGVKRIWVEFSDSNYAYPIDQAPFFQRTDTNRRISKAPLKHYIRSNNDSSVFNTLEANKTFLKDSIYYLNSAKRFRDDFHKITVNDKEILDLMLIGKINTDNVINIINKGQFSGKPALLFMDNLYTLNSHLSENTKYVFIDIHDDGIVNSQLDALDYLIKKDSPVIFLTDTVNSFNLEALGNRGFLTLRWDRTSILPDLYSTSAGDNVNSKVYNCGNKEINYELCDDFELSDIIKVLNKSRHFLEDNTQVLTNLYWQLYNVVISLLRNVIRIPEIVRSNIKNKIEDIEKSLKTQTYNISSENMNNLEQIILVIQNLLDGEYEYEKAKKTEQIICDGVFDNIVIIISDNDDKSVYINYWDNYITDNNLDKSIRIMYVQEYCNGIESIDAEIIVCGWLGKNKMRNIIYNNNAPLMHILLYKIEQNWKKRHVSEWEKIIRNERRYVFDKNIVFSDLSADELSENNEEESSQDIDNIENAIQEYKFSKYYTKNNQDTKNISVEVIPIMFVSGYFSFYKISSKVITVTEIINDISGNSKQNEKLSTDIETGDFVVIRETERSLIHELADGILKKEGKEEHRELSGQWKRGLNEKRSLYTTKQLHEKIVNEGSSIGLQAFRVWMDDDDFIAPQDKDNLLFIAAALNDNYLIENIDRIYEICKDVRSAHVKAGNILSKRLKNEIAKKLSDIPKIRRADLWDPIDLQLEDLGKVKILKVTSIGQKRFVDMYYTNKLLNENMREKYSIEGRHAMEVLLEYDLSAPDCRKKGFVLDENKIYRRAT
jgi:hypothetical protein